MIKAIIFDCFGVVVSDGFTGLISELKLTDSDAKSIAGLIDEVNKGSLDYKNYTEAASKIAGLPVDEYIKRMSDNVKNQPLLRYIKELRKNYKVGMLSNVGSRESLESRFDEGELNKYFDVVVASAEIRYAKPEAQAYEITATELGVRLENCVMIDDREEYCLGAKGVGMKSILYETFDGMKHELDNLLTLPSS